MNRPEKGTAADVRCTSTAAIRTDLHMAQAGSSCSVSLLAPVVNPALDELRGLPQWVAWRYDHGRKIPVDPGTGDNASTTDFTTWRTHDLALGRAQRSHLDGVGFVFAKDDPYSGIDFDDCIDAAGELSEQVGHWLARLGSYSEISPSGTGVKTWVRGRLPANFNESAKLGTEGYSHARYFCFTGRHLAHTPAVINDAQGALDELYAWVQSQRRPERERRIAAYNGDLRSDLAEVREALTYIDPWADGYAWWVRLLMAVHSEFPTADGLAVADAWAKGYDGEIAAKWKSFETTGNGTGKVTLATLFDEALRHGWRRRANGTDTARVTLRQSRATPALAAASTAAAAAAAADTPQRYSTMADLDGVLGDIAWDWPGWIAKGFAHLLVAEPGIGKSMLALRIAGTYLLGWPWPDGTPYTGEKGTVLWCETEAGHAPNRERAKSWGLPTESILYPVENPLDSISLQNMEQMATVRWLAQRGDLRLIIVDSFSGGNSRDENDAESGQVVKMLAEISRDTGLPLILTHHLNKGWRSNRITLTNIRGSTAIAQYVRLIWALDKPDQENRPTDLRLYAIKSNLAELPSELGLSIGANGLSALDKAPQAPRAETAVDQAIDFLLDALDREPLPKRDVEELAEGLSISGATLRRAADKLAIVKVKHRDGPWLWSLPARKSDEQLQ